MAKTECELQGPPFDWFRLFPIKGCASNPEAPISPL